jgi:hypothetical protein
MLWHGYTPIPVAKFQVDLVHRPCGDRGTNDESNTRAKVRLPQAVSPGTEGVELELTSPTTPELQP